MSVPMKLGLAGGPLVVAILLGRFGHKIHLVTYTSTGASLMLREIGICLFLASVGISAGGEFVNTIMSGGLIWVWWGFLITVIPLLIIGIIARAHYKINYCSIMGLLSGACTDPPALAYGNKADMEQTITMLEEVKEAILNAYVQKSHQSRETLSQLMSEETWMNAEKALELGLVDGILFADSPAPSTQTEPQPVQYSAKHTQNTLLHKLSAVAPIGIPIDQLEKRLALLKD